MRGIASTRRPFTGGVEQFDFGQSLTFKADKLRSFGFDITLDGGGRRSATTSNSCYIRQLRYLLVMRYKEG